MAPTGTISLLADNISSGVEPVFSFTHKRHILQPDGSREEVEASDHAYRLFRKLKGTAAALPPAFVDAQSLEPAAHVTMQAVVQDYIDSSVSKTINLSSDIAFDAFKDVYSQAYDLGCKGCTTYRPNEVTGAVLEAVSEGLDGEDAPQDRGGAVADLKVVQQILGHKHAAMTLDVYSHVIPDNLASAGERLGAIYEGSSG